MPIRMSVAKAMADTMTAPMVAPISGITSRSMTTNASATAYSPRPTTNRKISEEMPAQTATTKAPETYPPTLSMTRSPSLLTRSRREAGARR